MMPRMSTADPFGLDSAEGRADPYPVYARLREEAPVWFSPSWGAWLVTRHADAVAAFRDHRLSANRSSRYAAVLPPPVREHLAPLLRNLASWALLLDPPDHTRIRSLLARAFTPRLVEHLRPRVEAIAAELVGDVAAGGRVDLIAALAEPLPVLVIGEMLGLPPADRRRLKEWSSALTAFMGASKLSLDVAEDALAGVVEMEEYFRDLIAERRRAPGEDLLSALVAAEDRGAILGEQELLSTCTMVLFGGHETTTNLIGNAALTFLRHPEALAAIRADASIMGAAVEEVLRFEAPVQRMGRVAREDLEIAGQPIRAGDRVFLVMGSANRDPRAFADPDRFDPRRADSRHLTFGHGSHFCVGAALGRMEAEIALRTLLARCPSLAPVDEAPRWLDNLTVRGLAALPVDLGATA